LQNVNIKIFTSAEGENSHCACVIADLIFDLTKIELSNLITDQRHLIDDQNVIKFDSSILHERAFWYAIYTEVRFFFGNVQKPGHHGQKI